jgi:hypothetical protein
MGWREPEINPLITEAEWLNAANRPDSAEPIDQRRAPDSEPAGEGAGGIASRLVPPAAWWRRLLWERHKGAHRGTDS